MDRDLHSILTKLGMVLMAVIGAIFIIIDVQFNRVSSEHSKDFLYLLDDMGKLRREIIPPVAKRPGRPPAVPVE